MDLALERSPEGASGVRLVLLGTIECGPELRELLLQAISSTACGVFMHGIAQRPDSHHNPCELGAGVGFNFFPEGRRIDSTKQGMKFARGFERGHRKGRACHRSSEPWTLSQQDHKIVTVWS